MRLLWPRVVALAMTIALPGCSTATEPRGITDVDAARMLWLGHRPQAYRFEVALASSWSPRSGYYRIQVSAGQVVAARDSSGQAIADLTITIDSIWDELLAARANGELNSALFDQLGVPIEADMGEWPVDEGRHYSVRNFFRSR